MELLTILSIISLIMLILLLVGVYYINKNTDWEKLKTPDEIIQDMRDARIEFKCNLDKKKSKDMYNWAATEKKIDELIQDIRDGRMEFKHNLDKKKFGMSSEALDNIVQKCRSGRWVPYEEKSDRKLESTELISIKNDLYACRKKVTELNMDFENMKIFNNADRDKLNDLEKIVNYHNERITILEASIKKSKKQRNAK